VTLVPPHVPPNPAIVVPALLTPDLHDELMDRGRHSGFFWAADNKKLWDLMRSVCHGTTAWSSIARFERTHNGRGAYLAIMKQYLGEDAMHRLLLEAGRTVQNTRFDGSSRGFTYHKFCALFRRAMIDHGADNQLSPELQVIRFMNCFQVPTLVHLSAMIFGNPQYKYNLENTITFIATNLNAMETKNKPARNVSAFGQGNGHKHKDKGKDYKGKHGNKRKPFDKSKGKGRGKDKVKSTKGFDSANPAAYSQDWYSFTQEEKDAARKARMKAGIAKKSTISSITRKKGVSFENEDTSEDESEESDSDSEPPAKKQRTVQKLKTGSMSQRKKKGKAGK
jgi:hypothetical protein